MAGIALDAVCSRNEESSNSSYHRGLQIRASVSGGCVEDNPDLPLHSVR